MRYLVLFIMALILSHASQAAEPVPGDTCSTAGATMASNNSGIGHFMLCQGGTWKSVYSYNATGNLTKIGNLNCNTDEILKWNGTNWACGTASSVWLLNGAKAYYSAGNVGIGTNDPGWPLDVTGGIRASGEIVSTNSNQIRMIGGNYGAIWRNDGTNTYFLLTASGDQYGGWNDLRPFYINNATGDVGIGNALTVTGKISTTGIVKVGTQAACAAADTGSMRYAGGSAPWEYCDGGGTWRPFRQPRCQNDGAGECYLASPRSGDDPDFTAANIRCGVNILGVTGTLGDTTPDLFSFTDQTDVAISTLVTSNTVIIAGMDTTCGAVPVTLSGSGAPQISISGGGWVASGTIANGQTLQVRLTSSGTYGATNSATMTIAGVSDQWDVTTIAPCAGVMVGGYCWYMGSASQSCDTACSGHGGCNLTGTKDYAGSAGTDANCTSVLNALAQPGGSIVNALQDEGCVRQIIPVGQRIRGTNTTTCAASYSGVARACACNN